MDGSGNSLNPALRLVEPERETDCSFEGLCAREPLEVARFYREHVRRVERLLLVVLGPDRELADLVQHVFLEALSSLPQVRGGRESLIPWLHQIVVRVARRHIRTRRRRRWLSYFAPEELPELPSNLVDPRTRLVLQRSLAILSRLGPEERVCFSLRYVEGLKLERIAQLTGASLATVKRRLTAARVSFWSQASREPLLACWLEESGHGV